MSRYESCPFRILTEVPSYAYTRPNTQFGAREDIPCTTPVKELSLAECVVYLRRSRWTTPVMRRSLPDVDPVVVSSNYLHDRVMERMLVLRSELGDESYHVSLRGKEKEVEPAKVKQSWMRSREEYAAMAEARRLEIESKKEQDRAMMPALLAQMKETTDKVTREIADGLYVPSTVREIIKTVVELSTELSNIVSEQELIKVVLDEPEKTLVLPIISAQVETCVQMVGPMMISVKDNVETVTDERLVSVADLFKISDMEKRDDCWFTEVLDSFVARNEKQKEKIFKYRFKMRVINKASYIRWSDMCKLESRCLRSFVLSRESDIRLSESGRQVRHRILDVLSPYYGRKFSLDGRRRWEVVPSKGPYDVENVLESERYDIVISKILMSYRREVARIRDRHDGVIGSYKISLLVLDCLLNGFNGRTSRLVLSRFIQYHMYPIVIRLLVKRTSMIALIGRRSKPTVRFKIRAVPDLGS